MRTNPAFWITVFAGSDEIELTDRVLSLTFDEEQGKADKLTIQIDNFDLSNFDKPDVKTGNKVEFSFGYPGNMSPVRQGVIQKVTGSTVLAVEALGMSVLMNKHPKKRTFERMTIADVARQIAKENGYGTEVQIIDDNGLDGKPLPVEEQISQARLTDAALLMQWGKKIGFAFYVDFAGFHFHPKRLGAKPIRKFVYYLDKTGDIISFNIENDVYAKKTGGVKVQGRDPMKKEPIEESADNASTTNRTTLAPTVEIFTGISERDGTALPDVAKTTAATTVVPTTATSAVQAKQEAVAMFSGAQMGAVELTMQCIGDPNVVGQSVVECEFPGAKTISGNYFVKGVTHKLDSSGGYTMTVKTRRDGKTGTGSKNAKAPQVPSKGAQNNAYAPPADPLGLINRDLVPIDQRDGTVIYSDTGGRQNADAPQAEQTQSANPLDFYRID